VAKYTYFPAGRSYPRYYYFTPNQGPGTAEGVTGLYRRKFTGMRIDRWLENKSLHDPEKWIEESNHQNSDIGIYIRYAREIGLDKIGKGSSKFLSFGTYELPEEKSWLRSVYYDNDFMPFNGEKITEYIKYSFLKGYQGGLHPFEGITEPDSDKEEAYSWSKSPRYDDNVVEVGPLARMILDKDPLIYDIFNKLGPSVF
jgi:Ni,Fe-hydrogenase I large subunit